MAQNAMVSTWYDAGDAETLDALLAQYKARASAFGVDPMENPVVRLSVAAIEGDIEAAVRVANEEIFIEPVADHLDYPQQFSQSFLADVVADNRVQASIQKWDADKAALRKAVARFLAEFGETP